jgi:hypothetical protein
MNTLRYLQTAHMALATEVALRRRNRRNVYLLSWNTLSTWGMHSI